jgi:prepilin-type N-terminal cleavage/methylation domain-containing protein
MYSIRQHRSQKGFTLFELLVVIALMGIMATMAFPNLLRLIQRSKLTGIVQETSILMRLARDNAIRYNTQAVVRADLVTNEVIAFVDVDGVLAGDISDGIFNPIAGLPHRTTDWELARYRLPSRVTFTGPTSDPLPVWKFSPIAGENVALFASNGSADEEGAIRFADAFGNFLQVRVAPATTGRVRIEKYNDDDDKWYFRNETDKPWEWK